MQVNLEKLKEQLEREIQALEQKKVVLVDQVKHVEAVFRLAERMEPGDSGERAVEVEQAADAVEEREEEPEGVYEAEAEVEPAKVNGKPAEGSGGEGFEWAFQGDKAASGA